MSDELAQSDRRLLRSAVLAALAVRLIVVGLVYRGFLAPGREHWEFAFETGKIARSVVLGHGFANPFYGGNTGPTAWIAPVPPYILAAIFYAFGIYTTAAALAMLALNSFISALTCIPIFFAAKMSFGLTEARWAVWTWVFFPYAIYFSADSMWDHALLALLLTCILWMALHLQNSTRWQAWAGFGILCGFSALANPVVLSAVIALIAWACYSLHRQGKAWFASGTIATIVLCATITPWLIRNYRAFGKPVFLKDNFGLELCVGNIGNTLHWWNGLEQPSGSNADLAELHRLGEQRYMAEKSKLARAFIEDHPGIFLWRSIRRFVYLWTGYWSFNRRYLQEEPFDPANIPLCLATTVLALIGLRKMFQRRAGSATPFALVLIVFPLVYYVTHPDLGYRHPLDPGTIILACCAVVSWRTPKRTRIEEPELELVSQSIR